MHRTRASVASVVNSILYFFLSYKKILRIRINITTNRGEIIALYFFYSIKINIIMNRGEILVLYSFYSKKIDICRIRMNITRIQNEILKL